MADEKREHHKVHHVVVSKTERPGHTTIGVVIDGAFVPIAQHVDGLVEAAKQRWNELGPIVPETDTGSSVAELQNRVAELERSHQALEAKVKAGAKPAGGGRSTAKPDADK